MIGLNKEPRLRFTDEERADPALEKPIRKTEKATARADKAQANIPKKKVRQTVIDPDTGKKTSKLIFEDKKKPPSKLSQGVKEAPVHLVAGKFHKEIRETEQDNVGVESAHKSEEAVETSAYLVREGYRSHKLKPYRKAAQAEQKLEKANEMCIRDSLNALVWDGTERIRFCLRHFLGADADDYTYEALKLCLLGAISRAFQPGGKFEIMLCLVCLLYTSRCV